MANFAKQLAEAGAMGLTNRIPWLSEHDYAMCLVRPTYFEERYFLKQWIGSMGL